MKKKIIKIIIILLVIGFVGLLTTICVNFYVKISVNDKIIDVNKVANNNVDCILVLGAGLRTDGTPSPMLEDRLTTAINIYNENPNLPILVSGDNGTIEYNEVQAMKDYLISQGINQDVIYMDHAGFSTYDSVYRLKAVFQIKNVVIVTQEYHLYRALYLAKSLGINAYGVSASINDYRGQAYYSFREYLARNKDFVKGIIKPNPIFLGEIVPILELNQKSS